MNSLDYFYYLVVFKTNGFNCNGITIENYIEMKLNNYGRTHLIDDDVVPALPALEYCLHLPRNGLDVFDIDTEILSRSYDTSHKIMLCPSNVFEDVIKMRQYDLIITTDNCYDDVLKALPNQGITLGVCKCSSLNNELLKIHWKKLYEERKNKKLTIISDLDNQFLLKNNQLYFLPCLFLERQYGKVNEVYEKCFHSKNYIDDSNKIIMQRNVMQKALIKCRKYTDNASKFRDTYYKEINDTTNYSSNVVMSYVGVPKQQIKYAGLTNVLSNDEKNFIRFVTIHRAIAKHACCVVIPQVNQKLFNNLNSLEIACSTDRGTNNKYIHRMLKSIGKTFELDLSDTQRKYILNADNIDVFSNFPVGICMLNKCDVPLQCIKPISHRPISPLTRAIQFELVNKGQIYLGIGCNVLFVECVPNTIENTIVRQQSNAIINSLENCKVQNDKFRYVYKEAYSIKDLKKVLNDNYRNNEILVLSAHGFYERENNISGLVIGNEKWLGEDNDYFVPPVVLLSACHSSPRGNGCVNISDLLLRNGASAVLSTLIPIQAKRNAFLFSRLFFYILSAQLGSNQYRNLSEAWSGVSATNTIIDLASCSKDFENWLFSGEINDSNWYKFTTKESVGLLRRYSIYSDTIKIVKEMLTSQGISNSFNNILNENDYLPETFFYQWIGSPENIILFDDDIKRILTCKNNNSTN